MKTKQLKKDKINIVTLGCSKNLVDSENLYTQLKGNQLDVMHEGKSNANVVIVNTCGFIDLAKQESIDTILHYATQKSKGKIDKLYVTGCLSQRYKDQLEVEIPEVDAYFGTLEMPALLSKFNADYKHELIGERQITTPNHYAYVKISEGCNRTCSFCAIPLMRGKHVSRPMEDIVREVTFLAGKGVREVMLIAQELTYYGLDIYKKRALSDLLSRLNEIEGITWIRLHYAYPSKFPEEVFHSIASLDKVCKYLDLPLQHANDAVLNRMRRQITQKETVALIEKAREVVPGIGIRTTMLVGFPGETESEFEDLCSFVKAMRFERMGVFQYSHEEQTSAYDQVDDVPAEIKAERANRLMEIQREISLEKNYARVGTRMKILIDRKEGDHYVGRTEFDSPEVDNEVLIPAANNYLRIGDFAEIMITAASEYDLHGHLTDSQ